MLPVRPPRVSDANPLPDSAAFTVAALRYSFGLRLVKEARPAYRPDAISVRRSSWVMPSHFFQPMLHSIHLVLDFDLALYSWSRDFHPLDCVHAAHTYKGTKRCLILTKNLPIFYAVYLFA